MLSVSIITVAWHPFVSFLSVTGCNMNAGDLLGTGTISGPTDDSLGSLLEGSWRGAREVPLANSTETPAVRKFLKDGDTVIMSGYAQGEGYRVGFGSVSGKILPAGSTTKEAAAAAAKAALAETQVEGPRDLRLYSYWRSTSSWRVRLALALKGLAYAYASIDLLPVSSFSSFSHVFVATYHPDCDMYHFSVAACGQHHPDPGGQLPREELPGPAARARVHGPRDGRGAEPDPVAGDHRVPGGGLPRHPPRAAHLHHRESQGQTGESSLNYWKYTVF